MASRGTTIRYNADYTGTKSLVDRALSRTGTSFSWSNTVTRAGDLATAAQVTTLKNAVDAAWARYCANATSCTNRNSCTNHTNTSACSSNHTAVYGNCPNYTNRSSNNGNNADGSSNSSNNGDNGTVWGSYCYSVYRSGRKCGGEMDWHTLGHILSQVADL